MTSAERIRIGVIGTGWSDFLHLPVLRSHPNVELAALCGMRPDHTREIAGKHGVEQSFTDYRAMLAEARLDAVVVATPEDLHAEMVLAALDDGLHVLCEKPLAFTLDQATAMLRSAEAAGVVHQVMFTNRGLAHFRHLKTLLDQGYVGTPFEALLLWPTGWAPHSEPAPYAWHADPARSLGTVNELGAHAIDLARWYFGDVVSVQASLRRVVQRPGPAGEPMEATPDSVLLLLQFASGLHAGMHLGLANLAGPGLRLTGQTIVVHGTEGTLETRSDCWSTPQVAEARGLRVGDERAEDLVPPAEFTAGEGADAFAPFSTQSVGPRAFVDAILGRPSDAPTFVDGYEVQRVVDAAVTAARTGEAVVLGQPEH